MKESSRDTFYYCNQLSLDCIQKFNKVTFHTTQGNFVVELYFETNPLTVSNFLRNIKEEIYKDKEFYKILNFPNTKIIYSGINPNNYSLDINDDASQIASLIPLEITLKGDSYPKYGYQISDPIKLSRLINTFEPGTIAMVGFNELFSSSTEFFFTTNNMPELDGRYAIFGRVINGFEILEKLDKTDKIIKIEPF